MASAFFNMMFSSSSCAFLLSCLLYYIPFSLSTFLECWFVNDMRQNKSKNLTVIEENIDVIGRRRPVEWAHREIVVFSAVNS